MTQIRSMDYYAEADAADFNRHLVDGVKPRAHRGLKAVPGSSGYVSITSGSAHTREGVRIEETADQADLLEITPPGAGVSRIDRIVMRHTYVATYPNTPAIYEIIVGDEGDAADVVPPAEPADAITLGYGLIVDSGANYDTLIASDRDREDVRQFSLGDGDTAVGDYNGWPGWLDLLDAYRDTAIEVLVLGTIVGFGSFTIPSAWRIRGLLGKGVLSTDGSTVVKFEGRASAEGETQSGTNYLDDATGDFTHLSTNAVIMITDTGGAGTYRIGERISDTRIALYNADGSSPTFIGTTCHYTVIAQTPAMWDMFVVSQSAGARIVDFSYAGHVHLRNVVAVAQEAADSGFYSTTSNFALLKACRCEGSMTYALRDGGYTTNARVSLWAEGGNVSWATAGCQLDVRTPGTVSAGGTTGSGGVAWPFNVIHYPDGTLRDDVVDTGQLVDDAVTGDKVADDAIDTDQLADDAVDGDKIADEVVIPKHLGARSMYLRASFSTNTGATGKAAQDVAADIQLAKNGASQAVAHLGGSAFLTVDGVYSSWLVRKDDTGVYQVRPPCTIASAVITPTADPSSVVFSVIPIAASRIPRAEWDDTNKFWEFGFRGDDGSDVDTQFQLMFFGTA